MVILWHGYLTYIIILYLIWDLLPNFVNSTTTYLETKFSACSAVRIKIYLGIKYTKNHEWVETMKTGKSVRVGITNYAQQQLGEIVHV